MPSRHRVRAALALLGLAAGALVAPTLGAPAASADTPTVTGIDIASWQHPGGAAISWPKVAAAGHAFAIVKATEGTTYTNPYYKDDVAGAKAAGLIVGAYHFARPALPLSTATSQAKYFIKVTGTMRTAKTLPPVLDIESNDSLTVAQRIKWTKRFLNTVESLTGRTPMIYSYDNYLRTRLGNTTSLARYPLWYANYTSRVPTTLPGGWNAWTIWQYTSTGSVPGIKGDVDINRFNGTLSSLRKLANGTKAAPLPPGAPTDLTATLEAPDARLAWNAPTSTGGSPITNYVVSVDGGPPGYTPTTSFVAGPLTLGTHTVSVRAVSIIGTGPAAQLTFTLGTTPTGSGTAPPAATITELSTLTTVDRAGSALVTVTLRRADTLQLVPDTAVTIVRNPKAGVTTRRTVTTDELGVATATFVHRSNGIVVVRHAGSARLAPSRASVSVKVRPRPVAKLNRTKIKRGRIAVLKGSVSPLYAGEQIRRERRVRGVWRTWATSTVKSRGGYRFRIAGSPGKYRYRVVLPATKLHLRGASPTVRLRIVR